MVYTPDGSAERKGLLIDFDHATFKIDHPGDLADNQQSSPPAIERTVGSFFVPI